MHRSIEATASVTSAIISPATSAGQLQQPPHYTELFILQMNVGFKVQHQRGGVVLTMVLLTPRKLVVTQSAIFFSPFLLSPTLVT